MKYCKECGAPNVNKAQACSDCGGTEFEFKCEKCGTVFEDLDKCPNCGLAAGRRKKTCPECGEVYYSNACPNCGYTKTAPVTGKKATKAKPDHISVCGLIGTILGIVAIILNFFGFGIVFGIPAIILGLIGLLSAKKRNAQKGLSITALILGFVALLLFILTLAACKGVADSLNNTSYSYTTTGTGSVSQSAKKAAFPSVDFPETVFVDDDYCTFTVNSIDPNNSGSYSVKVSITNKSDKNITFSVRNPSLNGYSIEPLWSDKVLPGATTNGTIKFSHSDISKIGCDDVTSIIFDLYGYDSDDWSKDYTNKPVKIYPHGESAVKEYPRSDVGTDMVLFDNETCKMVVCGTGHRPILGYTLDVYLENKSTNKELMFNVDSGAINGVMIDPFWADSLSAGQRAYSSISWFDSALEEKGITNIETVTLAVCVTDMNRILDGRIVEDSFTLDFSNN